MRLGAAGGLVLAALICVALLAAPLSTAFGQDCPRGTLDKRYCDRDGDLVADPPTDKSKLVDPKVLVFAYTPVEDPAVYKKVWSGFLKHMSKVTGKRVQFFSVQSNAAQLEAMRAGRLHVAGFNTGSNPIAVSCAGFVPFAMMAAPDGSFGYEMEIITHSSSDIKKVEDIKGKTLAFTSPTSNSGFKAPSALLKAEFNMVKDRDFKAVFSGKHDNSVLGVANKDYPAASIANSVMHRMMVRGVVKKEDIRTIYKSQTFPTTGYGYAHNLKPSLAEKIKKSFFTFNWKGSALLKEFKKDGAFIPITHAKHWAVIRTIDKANGVSYACK
jgi:phosphonate transport system substrate-binding protein